MRALGLMYVVLIATAFVVRAQSVGTVNISGQIVQPQPSATTTTKVVSVTDPVTRVVTYAVISMVNGRQLAVFDSRANANQFAVTVNPSVAYRN